MSGPRDPFDGVDRISVVQELPVKYGDDIGDICPMCKQEVVAARAAAPPVEHDEWCDGSGSSAGGVCCRRATELRVPPPDRVTGLREALDECEPVHNAQHQPYGWIVPDWLMLRVRAALLAEPVPRPYPEPEIGYEAFERMIAEGKAEPVPLDGDVAAIVELARTYRPSKVHPHDGLEGQRLAVLCERIEELFAARLTAPKGETDDE